MNKSIKISGKILSRYSEIISDEALQFVQEIHSQFNNTRLKLLELLMTYSILLNLL